MFGIGGFELFLILLFGFLIFGPDKLPEIATTVGKAINKFKNAQDEVNKVIKTEVYDADSDEPFKNPLDALSKLGEDPKKKAAEASSAKPKQTAKPASSSSAQKQAKPAASTGTQKEESFAERKARYDRERAAKKAAEAAEAAGEGAASAAAAATVAAAAAAKPTVEAQQAAASAASAVETAPATGEGE